MAAWLICRWTGGGADLVVGVRLAVRADLGGAGRVVVEGVVTVDDRLRPTLGR
jgi:hypothetical protein